MISNIWKTWLLVLGGFLVLAILGGLYFETRGILEKRSAGDYPPDPEIGVTRSEITQTECEAARGRWNLCSSSCRGKVGVCIELCVPACECGGEANYACPKETTCSDLLGAPGQKPIGICKRVEEELARRHECGYSLRFKDGWGIQELGDRAIRITSGQNSVRVACAPEIPGIPLPAENIADISLNGVPAKLYHDASLKDGTPEDDLRARNLKLNLDISIRGTPGFVEEVAGRWLWQ
ncbi:MAG: hypothetical protein V1821_00325 [bacterium]